MASTYAIVATPTPGVEIAVLVPVQAASIAAALSPAALADAKELMEDQGWIEAADATGDALRDLIDDALKTGDLYLCERCHARVTTYTHRYEASGDEIALCQSGC
ncbi:hypothetical protein [Nonomuraea candida]|uniref:hypothetical protein n=1 Tax=Nonomuraea candida TaxID=359159 RepID=UPI0005BB8DB2|nr:hypothetical protein [Nonomuraea candida]